MRRIHLIILLLLLSGLACTPISTVRIPDMRDLDPRAANSFEKELNYIYRIDSSLYTDVMVAVVRSNILSSPSTMNLGEIFLSVALMEKANQFDCNGFFSRLNEQEKKLVRERMENHPFVCKDANYSMEDVLKSFPEVLSADINTYSGVDAHWAWFSASGDTQVLKRFLDNYLMNPKSCKACIKWSYSSMAQQNHDVKLFLEEYLKTKTPEEQTVLKEFLPH